MGKQWKQWRTIFLGSKITADGDCSHEIKDTCSLEEKLINLNRIFKNRGTTLLTKVYIVKTMVLPVVMYRRESRIIKKAEHQRIDAFKLWCRRLLRVPCTARDQTSQSWKKSALNIHWKDWCWSWSSNTLATWCNEPIYWKISWC